MKLFKAGQGTLQKKLSLVGQVLIMEDMNSAGHRTDLVFKLGMKWGLEGQTRTQRQGDFTAYSSMLQ
jgi:hypothetical protein